VTAYVGLLAVMFSWAEIVSMGSGVPLVFASPRFLTAFFAPKMMSRLACRDYEEMEDEDWNDQFCSYARC
jgi:hypothetical protein